MSIQQMLLGASGASGYNIDKSLRFRASASAYLNRTPASAGNTKTWTFSTWIKLGAVSGDFMLLDAGTANNLDFRVYLTNGVLTALSFNGTVLTTNIATAQVLRDPAAWYHIVVAIDTPQATASNRVKFYINGTLVTALSSTTYMSQNFDTQVNNSIVHTIGRYSWTASAYLDGYLADTYLIDGQALTPASFGETNALTGVWQPKAYTGTYGTNGFYLDFETTTSVAALGTDKSGNGNTWTVNNVSLTAGVTYDSMTDVPTLTSATAANFAVLNPLDNAASLSNANLTWTSTGNQGTRASFFVSSAKWYWEITSTVANQIAEHGVAQASQVITGTTAYPGAQTISWGFSNNSGSKSNNNVFTNIASGGTTNDVIMVALDCDNGKIWWGRNGTWFSSGDPATGANAAFTNISGSVAPMTGVGGAGAGTFAYNFGQRPFSYTPPTGFVALNTFNL